MKKSARELLVPLKTSGHCKYLLIAVLWSCSLECSNKTQSSFRLCIKSLAAGCRPKGRKKNLKEKIDLRLQDEDRLGNHINITDK